MKQKGEKSTLGGFAPTARASPIAIVLYYLFRAVSHRAPSPTGTNWHKWGDHDTQIFLKS